MPIINHYNGDLSFYSLKLFVTIPLTPPPSQNLIRILPKTYLARGIYSFPFRVPQTLVQGNSNACYSHRNHRRWAPFLTCCEDKSMAIKHPGPCLATNHPSLAALNDRTQVMPCSEWKGNHFNLQIPFRH